MAKFQIAYGEIRDWQVTIEVEAASDPELNIALIIKDVAQISGNNQRQIPRGHIQNQVDIRFIDKGLNLSKTLDQYDHRDIFVHIQKGPNTILAGNAKIQDSSYAVRDISGVVDLICDDSLKSLQTTFIQRPQPGSFITLSNALQNIFNQLNVDLSVKTGLSLFHSGTAGSGPSRIQNTRFRLYSLMGEEEEITYYKYLLRLADEFDFTIFQEHGNWYLLSNHQRRIGYGTLYDLDTGNESVDFSKIITESDLRKTESIEPRYTPMRLFGQIESNVTPPRDNTGLLNVEFNITDQDGSNDVPRHWEYIHPGMFTRPIMTEVQYRAQSQGMIFSQFIPVTNRLFSDVSIRFRVMMRFAEDQNSGLFRVRYARLRGFSGSTIYGYDTQSNEMSISSDGWFEYLQEYPSLEEDVNIVFEETINIRQLMNLEFQFWFDVIQDTAGSLIENPGIVYADVSVADSMAPNEEIYTIGSSNRQIQYNSQLNERRTNYYRSDLRYNDGSEWVESNRQWPTNPKHQTLAQRTSVNFSGKRTIFDLYISKALDLKLTDEINFQWRGQNWNCIPLRIRKYANPTTMNEVRLATIGTTPS